MSDDSTRSRAPFGQLGCILICGTIVVLLAAVFPVVNQGGGLKKAPENVALQRAHGICLALFQYANDNDGSYPDGKSSTEVFQKLMPNYASDPEIFCLPIPGKTPARQGQPLRPENVAWDIVCPVDNSTPDQMPLIFTTGYKVDFVPGGSAVPVIPPGPRYRNPRPKTFFDWFPGYDEGGPGAAVGHMDMSSLFRGADSTSLDSAGATPGTIHNFIDPKLDLAGKKYIQLTPDGPVP